MPTSTQYRVGLPFPLLPPHDDDSNTPSAFQDPVSAPDELFTLEFHVRYGVYPALAETLMAFGLCVWVPNAYGVGLPAWGLSQAVSASISTGGDVSLAGAFGSGGSKHLELDRWYKIKLSARWGAGGYAALHVDDALVYEVSAPVAWVGPPTANYDGTLGCFPDETNRPTFPGAVDYDDLAIRDGLGVEVYHATFDDGGDGSNYQAITSWRDAPRHYEFVRGAVGEALRVGWNPVEVITPDAMALHGYDRGVADVFERKPLRL